jgi:murein L,D-transpeptidase YcbB/YkuD
MKIRIVSVFALLVLIFSCNQKPSQTEIAEVLESMIDVSKNDSSLVVAYRENAFKPVWTQSGGLKKMAKNYLEALDEVVFDGLEKTDYFTDELS